MASGCDQCVWAVGVFAGHGHWVGIELCDTWPVKLFWFVTSVFRCQRCYFYIIIM